MLTCICSLSTRETEAGGLQGQGQSGLHSKTLYHYFENTYQINIVWYQIHTIQMCKLYANIVMNVDVEILNKMLGMAFNII